MAHETPDLGRCSRVAGRRIRFCTTIIILPPSQVHAWEIADQLLRLKRDVPTSTFAAHTMRGKVRRAPRIRSGGPPTSEANVVLSYLT